MSEKETKKENNKLEELELELSELKNKNLELLADMENLRKRTALEKEDNLKYRSAGFIMQILPTVDMLEGALKAKDVSEEVKNWLLGFEMIYNNFKMVLDSEGVEKIEPSTNDEFDHNWHQAIEEKESTDVETGKIIETKLVGYKLKGRLLRPASVIVSKTKEEKEIN